MASYIKLYSVLVCAMQLCIVPFARAAQEDSDELRYAQERESMVVDQIEARDIKDKRVLAAMRKVERHKFVPQMLRDISYTDSPLPIEGGQTISQPYIVALMTELLEIQGDEKVLEIGTGSGYQAAILAELCAHVYTIEILEPLATSAKKLLEELGYTNIGVKYGDGFLGWEEYAPYDGIIVTCAPLEVPQSLVEQLKDGGRLVIPVGSFYQELKVIEKNDGKITTENIIPVRFVPMLREKD